MTAFAPPPEPEPWRAAIEAAAQTDEAACVEALVAEADLGEAARRRIAAMAGRLVERVRADRAGHGGLDAFLREYDMATREGVVLMCLAEALLRVPDGGTADRLIADKIGGADWQRHVGHSDSAFVNASTWALMLTGRVLRVEDRPVGDAWSSLRRLIARSGEPLIRQAMIRAMRIMGRQFVMGRTIEEAIERAADDEARGILYSYDMLGESAHTARDAERYADAYRHAIAAVGAASGGRGPTSGPGVSVKLSALHPRFEAVKRDGLVRELVPRLRSLAVLAREADIGLCVDTEESHRLDITLDAFEAVAGDDAVAGWDGFGIAVQAYQKRAGPVIDWLAALARRLDRRFSVRLVKGAYWDAEIKRAQELGLDGYPVFTRKANTDVSYIACARRIIAAGPLFHPQFATHNAHTFAAVLEIAGGANMVEFQRLHGMGEALYEAARTEAGGAVRCRVYAPVGSHEDLLAYLVRRLLENGANSSFVNRLVDEHEPIAAIIADPVPRVASLKTKAHPRIPLPSQLFGGERRNAVGLDLADPAQQRTLARRMAEVERPWRAEAVVGGRTLGAARERPLHNPADRRRIIGTVLEIAPEVVAEAVETAARAAADWGRRPAADRAACLDRTADLLEGSLPELMALAVREAGKTMDDALSEVREAVDFCRYYAARARTDFAVPERLPGPTGESNQLRLVGRGVFACISPWNFPLAIFTGQVTAALAAGNAVVAKPAEQTPLMAARAVALMHEAGVPPEVLNLVPGDGAVGAALVRDRRVAGVAFTGSVETARTIARTLAARPGPIVPLIAETGGQNVMIADSTALPEQLVADAVASAFRSAGQRCSALRVLFVQQEIAGRVIDMLAGAMAELAVGDPARLSTDVGPVIDDEALARLEAHHRRLDSEARRLAIAPLTSEGEHGTYFPPVAYAIERLDWLEAEVFGPVLHVIAYAGDRLDSVLDAVNASGYGLTLGIHSRVDRFVRAVHDRLRVGNTYVNRTMIGAVVGVQPFGGEGLSGTGPKAGGPRYLHRFATERTLTVNTAAGGGNTELLSLDDDEE
jgi:RHH-type proline utilization regulon transcriptional repressor/proline dehydrogenase/delta 1-pyrroline-5-carboxylate dehydrogenase